jgi:hypothetical protein
LIVESVSGRTPSNTPTRPHWNPRQIAS